MCSMCMQPTTARALGERLVEAVIDAAVKSAALWVADPNPRAHAFYRKHGFVPDGTAQDEGGVREIRMALVRAPRSVAHSPVAAPRWRHGLDGARRRVSRLATLGSSSLVRRAWPRRYRRGRRR